MKIYQCLLGVVLLFALPLAASSVQLEAGNGLSSPINASLNLSQFLAVQFSLSATTNITSIFAATNQVGGGSILFEIGDSLSGGNVYWSANETFSGEVFTPSSLQLPTGTYFLIGKTMIGGGGGAWYGYSGFYGNLTTVMIGGTFPTLNDWFSQDQGASWHLQSQPGGLVWGFDISGNTATPAPEPETLPLLASALLTAATFGRRRINL